MEKNQEGREAMLQDDMMRASEERVRRMHDSTVFIVHDGEKCLAPGAGVDGAALHRATIQAVLHALYPAATDDEVERARPMVSWSIVAHARNSQYHYEERTLEALRISGVRVVRPGRKADAVETAVREELRHIADILPLFTQDAQRRTAVVLISGHGDFAGDVRRLKRCGKYPPQVLLVHGSYVSSAYRAQVPQGCSLPIWAQLVREATADESSTSESDDSSMFDESSTSGSDDSEVTDCDTDETGAGEQPTATVHATVPTNVSWSANRWVRWEVRERVKSFFPERPFVNVVKNQVEVENVPLEHVDAVHEVAQSFLNSIVDSKHWLFIDPSVMDQEMTAVGWDCNAHVQVRPPVSISCRVHNCSSVEMVRQKCSQLGIQLEDVQLRGSRFAVKIDRRGSLTAAEAMKLMAESGEFQFCSVLKAPLTIWSGGDDASIEAVTNRLLPKLRSAQRSMQGMLIPVRGGLQRASAEELANTHNVDIISCTQRGDSLNVIVEGGPVEVDAFLHAARMLARPQRGLCNRRISNLDLRSD